MDKQSIRVLALAVFWRDDEILVMEYYDPLKREKFYRPLGGAVEFGEHVADALRREIREEIGAEIKDVRLIKVMENLFVYNRAPGHEIVWMHEAAFAGPSFYARDTMPVEEDGMPGRAVWKPLSDFGVGRPPLYPEGLLDLLRDRQQQTADR